MFNIWLLIDIFNKWLLVNIFTIWLLVNIFNNWLLIDSDTILLVVETLVLLLLVVEKLMLLLLVKWEHLLEMMFMWASSSKLVITSWWLGHWSDQVYSETVFTQWLVLLYVQTLFFLFAHFVGYTATLSGHFHLLLFLQLFGEHPRLFHYLVLTICLSALRTIQHIHLHYYQYIYIYIYINII